MRKLSFFLIFMIAACESNPYSSVPNRPITLQDPWTRLVIRCPVYSRSFNVDTSHNETEKCARQHEVKGFVRIEHMAYMPAKYDYPQEGRYPERRWREGEYVPRW